MKVNLNTILTTFDGTPIVHQDQIPVTFFFVAVNSLNLAPQALNANNPNSNARHAAELRGGILEKMSGASDTASEIDLMPQEADEVLDCIAAAQSAVLYMAAKRVLNGVAIPPRIQEPPVEQAEGNERFEN